MKNLSENYKILLVNKPTGISTFDVVNRFKKQTQAKIKVGHAGTLDAFASGLVILLLSSESTRKFDYFKTLTKEYIAGVRLGWTTSTLDVEGDFIKSKSTLETKNIRSIIENETQSFLGEIEQKVPKFSAAKINGQPMYKMARGGTEIPERSKKVKIESIDLIGIKSNIVSLRVSCGSGTYIRQLTYDLFKNIGFDSFLYSLVRTKIGEFELKNAVELEDLNSENWENLVISGKI